MATRIFYAVQALGIDNSDAGSITWMKGVQSVGITTNFNLEQAFELGQLAIYQNIQNVPEIEVTAEKVIDGQTLLYSAAVQAGNAASGLVPATSQTAGLYLVIFDNTTKSSASGVPIGLVWCSGMRPSNVSYKFPVEGKSTESITFVGNDKKWIYPGNSGSNYPSIENTGNYHAPTSSGIFRRQHFVASGSAFPVEVLAAVGSGKVQNISVAADIKRENIFELGAFRPYTKYANFPIAVTTDFEVVALSGDLVTAVGDYPALADNSIKLYFNNGGSTLSLDMGTKNKLTSVNYTGGDTGGGNATITYSYQGFNFLTVTTT